MADDDGIVLTCMSHTEHGLSDEQIMKLVSHLPRSSGESSGISNPVGSGSTPDEGSNVIGRIGPKFMAHWCDWRKRCPICDQNRLLTKRTQG